MRSILILFLFLSHFTLFAHTEKPILTEEKNLTLINIDAEEDFTVLTYEDENGIIIHQIIAAIAINFLPEILYSICVLTVDKKDQIACDVIYNATSVLVALTGRRIYRGTTRGFKWSVAKGKTRGVTKIETSSYSYVASFKRIFKAYRKGCSSGSSIPWESITEIDFSNETKTYGVGNNSCHNMKYNIDNLYTCSFQNLVMEGWVNDRNKIFNKNNWNKKGKFVKANHDNILLLSQPNFDKKVFDITGLTYKDEVFEYLYEKVIRSKSNFSFRKKVKSDGKWYRLRLSDGRECWALAASSVYPNYSNSFSFIK